MKSLKLIISEKGLEKLRAFADESYLYRYIVNNYTELYEANIFNNPDLSKKLSEENLLFIKFNLTEDDELVVNDAMQDLRKSNATFYAYIYDDISKAFCIYRNFSGKLNLPLINNMFSEIDDFKVIKNIENYVFELEIEDEMEV